MRIARQLQRVLAKEIRLRELNVVDVLVQWNEEGERGPDYDPNVESTWPTSESRSETFPALVHFVQPLTSGIRQFAELQAGDVILDFLQDVPLPKRGRFVVDGKTYVQKDIGDELSEYWDVIIGGQRMMRTVVVTLAR